MLCNSSVLKVPTTAAMDGKSHFESDGICKTISPENSRLLIPSDAKKFLAILIKNANFEMPAVVTEYASSVTFTPNISSLLPTRNENVGVRFCHVGLYRTIRKCYLPGTLQLS